MIEKDPSDERTEQDDVDLNPESIRDLDVDSDDAGDVRGGAPCPGGSCAGSV